MGRVKTFTNGGDLLPSDLNEMEDDYEGSYAFKKHLLAASTRLDAPTAGTYLLGAGTAGAGVEHGSATAALAAFYLNPADYEESSVNKRTVKLIVQGTLITNAVAPAITFTVGLYPVATSAGAEAAVTITLGAVVAGSTVAFAVPAKETLNESATAAFTCPAAGFYTLGVVASGGATAKSSAAIRANLQMAQT